MAATTTLTINSPPPPPTEKRPRRRAREVRSRYMLTASSSPISSSSSSSPPYGDPHLGSSPRVGCPPHPHPHPHPLLPLPNKPHLPQQKQQRRSPSIPPPPDATDSELESSSSCFADENQPLRSVRRSSETPLLSGIQSEDNGTRRKRAVARLFNDDGSEQPQPPEHPKPIDAKRRPRTGTPVVNSLDRTSAGTSVSTLGSVSVGTPAARRTTARPPTPARAGPFPSENGSGNALDKTFSEDLEACRTRSVSDLRSSMPEATVSARWAVDGSSGRQDGREDSSCRALNPLCYRSLNLALSSCQQRPFDLGGSINGPLALMKPPQPPNTKLGFGLKKGGKLSGRQEDVHMLRLLHNQYLRWRLVNAKAQATVQARRNAAERSLLGLSVKISELQISVMEKRDELKQLKMRERLLSILEAQMSYLDEWDNLEGEYLSSLSGVTKALLDASLRLPIIGNVDYRELKEVLGSATCMLDSLSPFIRCFLPKVEGIENIASDLARVVKSERSLIEDCGNLLSEAHNMQGKECSLISQLMQLKQSDVM